MIVAGSASPLLLSSAGGYNLTNSLRFRASASAYLNRTPASAGNRKTWTWSGWVKLGSLGVTRQIFGTGAGATHAALVFEAGNTLFAFSADANQTFLRTTQVLRDPSAWYHIVWAEDTTQATSSNRSKLYINGVQITAFSTANYPSLDFQGNINNNVAHYISSYDGSTWLYDGYLAEVNFIDGQALTPSSFGETSTSTGVWIPKKYTGTYGTNGFYLDFEDTSSTSALGYDAAGSNDWTVNNISLTAGSTYDSMTDVPTLTSATAANYCVINPLANSGIGTLSRGNLQLVTSTNSKTITGTMALPSTGQYYWEITATDYITDNGTFFGVVNQEFLTGAPSNGTWLGFNTYSGTYNNGTTTDTNGLTGTNVTNDGDIWCIAVDMTNGKFWIGRSRAGSLTWADGTTPAVNGSGATTLSLPTGTLYPMAYRGGSDNETYNFNFGQQPFAHTPPSGFVALNTFNLPTPTIGATASTQANDYFNAITWTGTGGTRSITGVGFQPDFVWAKARSQAYSNIVFDSNRGVGKSLLTDTTGAEATNEANGYISSFDADGFSSNFSAAANYYFNENGTTYVSWNWKANGAGSSNTDGTITSTVSANTSAGFSIVTYTGTGANATVGHGLGVAPSMVIYKRRSASDGWAVYFSSIGAANNLVLQSTAAQQANGNVYWNSTAPTSTVFTAGTDSAVNASTATYVAYCFAPVAGYSAFGSYTGNGSSDGPFIFTGFRPRFVMFKGSSIASNWCMLDSSRNTYNLTDATLQANDSAAELTNLSDVDFLSNGIKIRDVVTNDTNVSGETYIYMVFAENPFKYANAR
jgi:hypothetical protein